MYESSGNLSDSNSSPAELPPCCGTGCAVCVLDMVEDYAPPVSSACCNTGCAVCVNDYPELRESTGADSNALALLDAIEAAERSLQ